MSDPPPAFLTTERLGLHPPTRADAAFVHRTSLDERVWRTGFTPFPRSREAVAEFLAEGANGDDRVDFLVRVRDGDPGDGFTDAAATHAADTVDEVASDDGRDGVVSDDGTDGAASSDDDADGAAAAESADRTDDGPHPDPAGRRAGMVSLTDVDYRRSSAEVGYWLAPAAQGHGYATAAVERVLTYAFDTLDLHRIEAEVDAPNDASVGLLESLGFTHEGTRREVRVLDGERVDMHVYGLLAPEWDDGD
ncbi:GNAT family N-acetyltransferase [Halobaculum sp. MBLA0147]|uniref:GNAT family N-acetyltransferase n=1 Tax=Halobaculum sp. MBLA0147 TaxID=3079934 RepID=UPI003523794E